MGALNLNPLFGTLIQPLHFPLDIEHCQVTFRVQRIISRIFILLVDNTLVWTVRDHFGVRVITLLELYVCISQVEWANRIFIQGPGLPERDPRLQS